MTLIIARSNAPIMSNFINVGASDGGIETTPLKLTIPRNIPIIVIPRTPMIIAPGIFLTDKIVIDKKPKAARRVSILEKSPKLNKVASFEIIIPPLFKPIKPINKPTPEPIAILRFNGILSNIHLLKGVTLIITNKIPAKKTAPSAISHA